MFRVCLSIVHAVCPIGTYSSPANRNCSTCPNNSFSTMAGLRQCTCIEGYYRALTGEEDLPCSRKYTIVLQCTELYSWPLANIRAVHSNGL